MANKILFIEANTTGTGMIALQNVISWGLLPVFYTNDPERYVGLHEIECEIYQCDTNQIDLLKETIESTVPRQDMLGITTTSEFYLEQVAILTSHFGLPGNEFEAVRKVRNKALTRISLNKSKILQPKFIVVQNRSEVDAAIDQIGLPCVVKPVDDSGSNGVRLCYTNEMVQEQVESILKIKTNIRGQKTARCALIEEYLDAPEFSVETMSWQGQTIVIGITQKILTGFPYFVESGHFFPAALSSDQVEQMKRTVCKALKTIGFRNGAAHTEVKWTKQGCAIIEINGRLAGGMIPELIRLSTGIDVLEQQIRCSYEKPNLDQFQVNGVAGIRFLMAPKEGQVFAIHGIQEAANISGVQLVQVHVKTGSHIQLPQNAYHRLGYVIAYGVDKDETAKILAKAMDSIRIDTE